MPSPSTPTDKVLISHLNGVATLTMNRPKRLNGWTADMLEALKEALNTVATDPAVKAAIVTGKGRYYCAGVHMGGALMVAHPKEVHATITAHNEAVFGMFLNFPKPILVAANGPVIGAATTSATLCDGIIAAEEATFSTPFAALGVSPEGCSSVLFPRLLGPKTAERMLGSEGWVPDAAEAKAAGLIQWVVPGEALMTEAQRIAEGWVKGDEKRSYRGDSDLDELRAVNARESVGVADSFLSAYFLKNQFKFLWSKGKRKPAGMFLSLWLTRPLWSRML